MNDDPLAGLPTAAPWSLWAGTAGRGLIYCALALFLASIVLWALQRQRPALSKLATASFVLGAVSVFGAMACLCALFIRDQFQYEYVFQHADALTDLKYKIAGVWSAQQGSFLLWACTSALFGLLAFPTTGGYKRWFLITFSAFLAALCGILSYETPFALIKDAQAHGQVFVPPTGNGLTPSLQNYWVVIHPPTIFSGFGSLTVLFAYAVAAMATGNVLDWVKQVRPWTLISMSILGLGLCMGGLWAYETQGWGGFWAWDPVENVSLVPWLFCAALIHGTIVQVTKSRWVWVNLLLAGAPFLSFVYGTYLTRSGLLDNVSLHSFASMNKSALVILAVFLIASFIVFGALLFTRGLVLAKAHTVIDDEIGLKRDSLYNFGVLMLSLLAVVLAVGMSWSWIVALRGGRVEKVEEWLYHQVVVWFFIPIMLLMAIAPFVAWRAMGVKELWNRLVNVLSLTIGLTGFALLWINAPGIGAHVQPGSTVATPLHGKFPLVPWMVVLLFLCLFVVVAQLWRIGETMKRTKSSLGGFVAHIGLATLLGGLIISRGFEQKAQVFVREGDPARALDYLISYKDISRKDIFDRDGKVLFNVEDPSGHSFTATPGLYFLPGEDDNGQPKAMVWPHIERALSHDVYMSMQPPEVLAWEQPVSFKVGQTQTVQDVTVHYLGIERTGQPGQVGTKFGARLKIDYQGSHYQAVPTMTVGQGGPERDMPKVGNDFRIVLIAMNAADRSVQLQLLLSPPIFPIELFYKPMTILVWLGTGILTLGGLISAFTRRPRRKPGATQPVPTPAKDVLVEA